MKYFQMKTAMQLTDDEAGQLTQAIHYSIVDKFKSSDECATSSNTNNNGTRT